MSVNLAKCYSPDEVAERFGVKTSKVISWVISGQLVGINIATNPRGKRARWKIPPESLQEFEARRSSKPTPSSTPRRRSRQTNPDDIVFFK